MHKFFRPTALVGLALFSLAGTAVAEQIVINGKTHTKGYCGPPATTVIYVGALSQERADHLCACQHIASYSCSDADKAEAKRLQLTATAYSEKIDGGAKK